ncbi:MAG TPA: DUF885 domain-containing protein [Micromonosporaceae bacterium]|nr:DUF885 domain-containing protein [Micromonosporaceae bacterium]
MFADLADQYFDEYCRLDPVYATLCGRAGFDAALPDYSPDGWAARVDLLRGTLTRLNDAPVLRERLAAELAYLDSGLAASLNIVVSPPVLIRTALEQTTDPDDRRARLAALPDALAGYLRTLRETGPASRRQAEMMLGAVRFWAQGEPAFAGFADGLERDVLPTAHGPDGIGPERYAVAARHALGLDVDLAETRAWLTDRLAELTERTRIVAAGIARGRTVREVADLLDADPRWHVRVDELQQWAQKQLEASFDLVHGTVLEVPEPLRRVEAVVAEQPEAGPVRYLPPAATGTRPGRVHWPVPAGQDSTPVWRELTMIHHEGVPGHHLQVGAALLDERLPLWQRHTTVFGHAEGWAVYAEGLMAELGALAEPAQLFGYLMGLRANAAVALADIGLHCLGWTDERVLELLREHTTIPEAMLYFTVLRTAAWPGQALTYACGERVWRAARQRAERVRGKHFDLRRFHAEMLAIGPCGLKILEDQAGFRATTMA